MSFQDRVQMVGHLNIKSVRDGQVVEEFEEKNMIMDTARETMARLLYDKNTGFSINKFGIGISGKVPSTDPVDPTDIDLDSIGSPTANSTGYSYIIDMATKEGTHYNGTGVVGTADSTLNVFNANYVAGSSTVTYSIEIPEPNAMYNKSGSDGYNFDEVALYCSIDDTRTNFKIFSKKYMGIRFKDENTKLVITWSINF